MTTREVVLGIRSFFGLKTPQKEIVIQTEQIHPAARATTGTPVKVIEKFSTIIKPTVKRPVAIELREWQRAVMAATNYENPNMLLLYTLYERAMYDDTVIAAIGNRTGRVKQSRFKWVSDSTGKENEELTKQFKRKWFYDFMQYSMESLMWGHSLMQVTELDKNSEIQKLVLVNRRHVKPKFKWVTKNEGDNKGEPYDKPPVSNFTFEVGEVMDMGLLVKIVPFIALKNMGLSAWAIYMEKIGMPIRTVKTSNTDRKRLDQLAAAMADMGINMWIVLQGDEELELLSPSQGAEGSTNYNAFLNRIDNAIARILLGNDATLSTKDNKGTYASISAMAEFQEYLHWGDKTFMEHIVNLNLDKFAVLGYKVDGHRFEWDDFEELSVEDIVSNTAKLAPYAEIDWKIIQEKTGIPTLGPKVNVSVNVKAEDPLGK